MRWAVLLLLTTPAIAAEPIRIAPGGHTFVAGQGGTPFVPWGFNYDHDGRGRLIEDYWHEEWPTVEADFAEMRALGANVVRIHLQLGRFLPEPDRPDPRELARLRELLTLAERTGLRLDLTGLGCYHAAEVPAWYAALPEAGRWDAQAAFWSAIAATCADSPAVFCYDLMNEPVVPGEPRTDWLAGAFGGKHFVQFLTRDPAGRTRGDIGRAWLRRMTAAVRMHDPERFITVGLIPGGPANPGAFFGLTPAELATELDFLSIHLYPKSGQLDDAQATLRAFTAAGVPVVIEETFPLHCTPAEMDEFLTRSTPAAGWIGFYWGTPPDDLRTADTPAAALTLAWLTRFRQGPPHPTEVPANHAKERDNQE